MSEINIQEERFTSDEELDDQTGESDSSTDVDEKVEQDDVFDLEFLKCYSALKQKSEKIYDKNVKFFSEETDDSDAEPNKNNRQVDEMMKPLLPTTKKLTKPRLTLLDQQLSMGDEIEELPSDKTKVDLNATVSKSYYEKELEEIRKKISDTIDSDSDDDLIVVKGTGKSATGSKSKQTINAILSKIENTDDTELQHLKCMWDNPDNLSEEDKFLREYILNKRYLPKNVDNIDDGAKCGFFSENLNDLSDAEDDDRSPKEVQKKSKVSFHSDEKSFDEISRIPRNATQTIRDMTEKRIKKEKRLKKVEKDKKKKKAIKDADFEDVVGDLHTKFHYRETEPNDYGLSPQELLSATDEELEQWISVIDAIKYRSEEEEIALKQKFEQKRNDIELKKKIFKSIYGEDSGASSSDTTIRAKRKRKDSHQSIEDLEPKEEVIVKEESNTQKKKKKRKRGLNHKKFAKVGVAPDRLLAYGITKTKLRKHKLL